MDKKKETEKIIDAKFKEYFKNTTIPNYSIKLTKRWLKIKNKENVTAAEIMYDFAGNRFTGLGAITTLHLNPFVENCKISEVFNALGMVDKIPPHYIFMPMDMGRYKFPKSDKYSGGADFHFYSTDDLEKRIEDFILPIKNDILPRIDNFLNHKMKLINDIVDCQNYYKYPFATMLITLYLNNKADENSINEIYELANKHKLYDLKYKEFAEKITMYFSAPIQPNKNACT